MEKVAKDLVNDYAWNTRLIHQLTDGVSDEESVLQPAFETNCMNWVLGHIISRRQSSLLCLDQPPLWPKEILVKYSTGSKPIKSAAQARSLAQLLSDLDKSQRQLAAALEQASAADLQAEVENDRGRKRAVEHIKSFHWHETYHLGQLELLRAFIEATRAD